MSSSTSRLARPQGSTFTLDGTKKQWRYNGERINPSISIIWYYDMAVCQNLVPLVNIKIAGKWMFIPLKIVLIGIDPYPYYDMILYHDLMGLNKQNMLIQHDTTSWQFNGLKGKTIQETVGVNSEIQRGGVSIFPSSSGNGLSPQIFWDEKKPADMFYFGGFNEPNLLIP
jgi:hypothetical protein